jgi:DNA-binding NarL/FixJ family response regulator
VSPERLVTAVRMVRDGDALLAPTITRRLVERFASRSAQATSLHRDLAKLSLRDRARAIIVAYETGLITPGSADGPDHRGRS